MNGLQQARVAVSKGKLAEAASILEQYLRANSSDSAAVQFLGVVKFQLGAQEEGRRLVEAALATDPGNAEGWNSLGLILHLSGKSGNAIPAFQRATELAPSYGEAWMNLGFALQQTGSDEEAIEAFRSATESGFGNPQVLFFWGNSLATLMRHDEAVEKFDEALKVVPAYGDALNNRGNSLLALGRYEDAIDSLSRAGKLLPGNPLPFVNLASALHHIGKSDEALSILDQVLYHVPDCAEAHRIHADILGDLNRVEQAAEILSKAVARHPEAVDTKAAFARTLHHMGKWRAVLDLLSGDTDPGLQTIRTVTLPAMLESGAMIDEARDHLRQAAARLTGSGLHLRDPVKEVGLTTFFLAYHGIGERELQEGVARMYRSICPALRFSAGHTPGKGRIRLGVLCSFMRTHTIGKLYARMFEMLDRTRFELVFMQIGKVDDASKRFAGSADRHVMVAPSLNVARQQIAKEQVDILLFPEVGMEAQTYFLAFSRLAPVQCVLWGHPMTTGTPTMDWFISSQHLERPDGHLEYSERLAQLPSLNTYFEKPSLPPPLSRSEIGLPDDRRLYACPQSTFKFHPDFDRVLNEILVQDPEGLLVMIDPSSAHWKEILLKRWRRDFPLLADRSYFMPQMRLERFLRLCQLADCMLDPIQFGGGNSSLECFAVGAPVVTLPQGLLRNRITYSAYRQVGWMDMVARDEAHYVEIALRLARDREWQAEMRNLTLERTQALFCNAAAVRELEDFLESVRPS